MTFKVHNSLPVDLSNRSNTVATALVVLLTVLFLNHLPAAHGESATNISAIYFKAVLEAKEAAYRNNSTNNDIAYELARACFDFADFATNDTHRAQIAQLGIKTCRAVIRRVPNNMQAHYALALNLGQLARTKTLGALSIVDEMETEFLAARALDEKFDFAGPDRTLGMLYRDAPGTISIGSKSKARTHMQRAVDLAPDYPENRLNLAEIRLSGRDRDAARRELEALEAGLTKARAQFTGDAWAASWFDWDQRIQKLRNQLKAPLKPIVTSPKGATK